MSLENKIPTLEIEAETKIECLFIDKMLIFSTILVTLHSYRGITHNHIKLWSILTFKCKVVYFSEDLVNIFELQDGICACAFNNGKVILYDVFLEKEIAILKEHTEKVTAIIDIKDGYITLSEDESFKIWKEDECIRTVKCLTIFNHITLLPDDRFILGAGNSRDLIVFSMTGELIVSLPHHNLGISLLRILSDGSLLSQCRQGEIRIWNTKTWKYIQLFETFDTDISKCKNFSLVRSLPEKIIDEISTDGTLYNIGDKFLIYFFKNNPVTVIVDIINEKSYTEFIPHHRSVLLEDKLIIGNLDSLCIYTIK